MRRIQMLARRLSYTFNFLRPPFTRRPLYNNNILRRTPSPDRCHIDPLYIITDCGIK